MASKRVSPKASASAGAGSPLANAALLALALAGAISSLFFRGRLSWPPTELLASLFTIAGYLAMIGPIVLRGKESAEVGLGELLWMSGGLVVWVFDFAALVRGDYKATAWSTPLGYQPMGLTILAVLIASWRCRVGGGGWSWTNVTGWALGLFWVGMAGMTLVPARLLGVAMR